MVNVYIDKQNNNKGKYIASRKNKKITITWNQIEQRREQHNLQEIKPQNNRQKTENWVPNPSKNEDEFRWSEMENSQKSCNKSYSVITHKQRKDVLLAKTNGTHP